MAQASRITFALTLLLAGPLRADEPAKSDGSDLGISIMGSIVQKNGDDNVALVKDAKGTVLAVKKDFVILEKYKVLAVHPQYIEVITRDAKRHWIYQDKFAGTFANKGAVASNSVTGRGEQFKEEGFERNKGKVVMTGMYRDKLVKEDLAKVMMQATAEPFMENGGITGFKVTQIDDGSIFSKAGLVDNDVITSINGQELNSVAGSIKLLQSLKGTDHLEVDLKRDGVQMKFTIDVN